MNWNFSFTPTKGTETVDEQTQTNEFAADAVDLSGTTPNPSRQLPPIPPSSSPPASTPTNTASALPTPRKRRGRPLGSGKSVNTPKKKSAKPNKSCVRPSSKKNTKKNTVATTEYTGFEDNERRFRALVLTMGSDRASVIIADVNNQLKVLINGE